MRLYRLDAIALELGPGADAFLQAYTTQAPAAPRGAFIDAKGKAVGVYDHVRLDADRSILVIPRITHERLVRHLKNYLFLTGADLRVLPHAAYWDLDSSAVPPETAASHQGEWAIPRAQGQILVTTRAMDATVSEEDFRVFRIRHRLALQGVDYDDPMLLNLDDPELVSFTKGCYLGQEIMARVHYRGKPPLKLAAVREADCPPDLKEKMTSRVRDGVSGEVAGFVFLPASE